MYENKGINWDEIKDLGKVTDASIALRLGVARSSVSRARIHRDIPAFKRHADYNSVDELGKIPDAELARKLGVDKASIHKARQHRGIQALNPKPFLHIDWDSIVLLGQITDLHLADILGCSYSTVCMEHKKRNIKPASLHYSTQEHEGAYYVEAIIDMWLHNQNIKHIFQYKVGPYRVDWYLPDTNEIWEYLGFWNHRVYGAEYRKKFAKKKCYFKKLGYTVREIHIDEANYFKKDIDLKSIHNLGTFECKGCGRTNVKHDSRGLCGRCYTRWYKQTHKTLDN